MVRFGKKLKERQVPEWEEYYISYKLMKKKVKQYARQVQGGNKEDRKRVLRDFSDMLDHQVEKTVLFLLSKQGQLATRLSKLADERETKDWEEGVGRGHMAVLLEAYRAVGRDLLKLLYFVEVNATGLRKIMKKFDKHIGYHLSDEYVATRSNHPYSQLQQVFRHVGIGAMVGTISRNLAELQAEGQRIVSMYDHPSALVFHDPIIESIKAAEDRLTNSTSFLQFLGKQALYASDDLARSPEEGIEEEEYHFMSLVLNLANTFLYMVNTYIIVPTADKYAESLGAAPTLCGVIIGSMAVAQLVSSIYLSAWSNKSYFGPLIFSSMVLCLGNVVYAIAYDLKSVTILLIGRLLCGLGSARAVNRRYISDCVPAKSRLQASAAFVSASALGMASGPALAAVLDFETTVFGLTLNGNTLPGWVMAGGWLVYLVWVWSGFKEPSHDPDTYESTEGNDTNVIVDSPEESLANEQGREDGFLEPLLSVIVRPTETEAEAEAADDYLDDRADSEVSEESARPANSIQEAYQLLTSSVKVQLFIYFFLKFAMEVLISESSVVTAYYFQWGTHLVALFLAFLGLTVLPVNWVVGSVASNIFEERQLLLAAEISTCFGVVVSFTYGLVPYTVAQYVCGALLIFVSAEVLEGVNLALLSKVMSSRLAGGTFNGGLLSTQAGTLARVVADGTITLAGYLGESKLVNVTMFPTLIFGVASIIGTLYTYNSLF